MDRKSHPRRPGVEVWTEEGRTRSGGFTVQQSFDPLTEKEDEALDRFRKEVDRVKREDR